MDEYIAAISPKLPRIWFGLISPTDIFNPLNVFALKYVGGFSMSKMPKSRHVSSVLYSIHYAIDHPIKFLYAHVHPSIFISFINWHLRAKLFRGVKINIFKKKATFVIHGWSSDTPQYGNYIKHENMVDLEVYGFKHNGIGVWTFVGKTPRNGPYWKVAERIRWTLDYAAISDKLFYSLPFTSRNFAPLN